MYVSPRICQRKNLIDERRAGCRCGVDADGASYTCCKYIVDEGPLQRREGMKRGALKIHEGQISIATFPVPWIVAILVVVRRKASKHDTLFGPWSGSGSGCIEGKGRAAVLMLEVDGIRIVQLPLTLLLLFSGSFPSLRPS